MKIGTDDPSPEISIAYQEKYVNSNIEKHATYKEEKPSEKDKKP